jgi:hypothetical protein
MGNFTTSFGEDILGLSTRNFLLFLLNFLLRSEKLILWLKIFLMINFQDGVPLSYPRQFLEVLMWQASSTGRKKTIND